MHSVAGPGGAMYGASRTSLPPAVIAAPATLTAASQDLAAVPPEERVAASEYDSFLAQLKFNSKEIINNLTKIAGENVKSANGIAFVVERRILNSPPQEKLPYLYLLDSIVKNIHGVYVARFSRNLYNVFMNVFTVSSPETRASMDRLLNTWPPIFGHELVGALRRAANPQLQMPSAAPAATHHPVSSAPTITRIRRIPLSRPAPKVSNHPGRNRSIVQVPIPKRQPAVQMSSSAMPMGLAGAAPIVAQSSMAPALGVPMQGMHGMYGQAMQQMVQPGLHGGQTLAHQGVQGVGGMASMPNMHGLQGIQGMQGVQGMHQGYGMPQPLVQPQIPGQSQGLHPGIAVSSRVSGGPGYSGVTPGVASGGVTAGRTGEVQRLMAELTRKSAMRIVLTNEEYSGINSFIDMQLRSALSHSERDLVLALQQQLRAMPAAASVAQQPSALQAGIQTGAAQQPQQRQRPPYGAAGAPPPQSHVVPAIDANSLSNLMRSLPQLARSAHAVQRAELAQAQRVHAAHPDPRPTIPARPVIRAPVPMPFSAIQTTSHTAFVRQIYSDLRNMSKSDGMRFATKEELRTHLDWLFARNRRKRARDQNLSSAGISRCWFDPLAVFLGEKSVTPGVSGLSTSVPSSSGVEPSTPEDPLNASVEAQSDTERCPACFEEHVSFWDDDKQTWMLQEAIRNKHGKAYHTRCAASIPNLDEHESFDAAAESTDGMQVQAKKEENKLPLTANKAGVVGDHLSVDQKPAAPTTVHKSKVELSSTAPMSVGPVGKGEAVVSGAGAEAKTTEGSLEASRKRPIEIENSPHVGSEVSRDGRATKRAKGEESDLGGESRKRTGEECAKPPPSVPKLSGDEPSSKRSKPDLTSAVTSSESGIEKVSGAEPVAPATVPKELLKESATIPVPTSSMNPPKAV